MTPRRARLRCYCRQTSTAAEQTQYNHAPRRAWLDWFQTRRTARLKSTTIGTLVVVMGLNRTRSTSVHGRNTGQAGHPTEVKGGFSATAPRTASIAPEADAASNRSSWRWRLYTGHVRGRPSWGTQPVQSMESFNRCRLAIILVCQHAVATWPSAEKTGANQLALSPRRASSAWHPLVPRALQASSIWSKVVPDVRLRHGETDSGEGGGLEPAENQLSSVAAKLNTGWQERAPNHYQAGARTLAASLGSRVAELRREHLRRLATRST